MCDLDEQKKERVNTALSVWRQGDFVQTDKPFLHLADTKEPLTSRSERLAAEGSSNDLGLSTVAYEVKGLVVITQTCDLVRSCLEKPYVSVVPLVELLETDVDKMEEIRRGWRLNYAYIPGASSFGLVADLERVMTVEKSVVAGWNRCEGCKSDEDVRRVAEAIKRKFARFAFPDDFIKSIKKFRERIRQKHGKNTDEGILYRALREIRVTASPSWNAELIDLFFWFIVDEGAELPSKNLRNELRQKWLDLIQKQAKFRIIEGTMCGLEDMSAKDYVESDPLNFDDLSLN